MMKMYQLRRGRLLSFSKGSEFSNSQITQTNRHTSSREREWITWHNCGIHFGDNNMPEIVNRFICGLVLKILTRVLHVWWPHIQVWETYLQRTKDDVVVVKWTGGIPRFDWGSETDRLLTVFFSFLSSSKTFSISAFGSCRVNLAFFD